MKQHLLFLIAAIGAVLINGCYIGSVTGKGPHTLRGSYYMDTTMTIEISNLGSQINTAGYNYAPFINAKGRALYFTSATIGTTMDLFVATKKRDADTVWQSVTSLPAPINSPMNEGSMTFSANDSVVVLVACNRSSGLGDCDLYAISDAYSDKSRIENLRQVNSAYWDSAPALSSDGKTLYFLSNRPGAIGGADDADIYVCHMMEEGTWSKPVNLGAPINNGSRQDSPFVGPGDSILFFSSVAPGGYGGLDVYMSVRQPDGSWGKPTNLGQPINSKGDEIYYSFTAGGFVHYFSSNRVDMKNLGGYDIYMGQLVP